MPVTNDEVKALLGPGFHLDEPELAWLRRVLEILSARRSTSPTREEVADLLALGLTAKTNQEAAEALRQQGFPLPGAVRPAEEPAVPKSGGTDPFEDPAFKDLLEQLQRDAPQLDALLAELRETPLPDLSTPGTLPTGLNAPVADTRPPLERCKQAFRALSPTDRIQFFRWIAEGGPDAEKRQRKGSRRRKDAGPQP